MVGLLLFAGDPMLATEGEENAERNVEVLDGMMTKFRVTINLGKTKAVVVKRGGVTCNITKNGVELKHL